jgi:hypothetical protein
MHCDSHLHSRIQVLPQGVSLSFFIHSLTHVLLLLSQLPPGSNLFTLFKGVISEAMNGREMVTFSFLSNTPPLHTHFVLLSQT